MEDGRPEPGIAAYERMEDVDELEWECLWDLSRELPNRPLVHIEIHEREKNRHWLLTTQKADKDPFAMELHHLLLYRPHSVESFLDHLLCHSSLLSHRPALCRTLCVDKCPCLLAHLSHPRLRCIGNTMGAVVFAVVDAVPHRKPQHQGQICRMCCAIVPFWIARA